MSSVVRVSPYVFFVSFGLPSFGVTISVFFNMYDVVPLGLPPLGVTVVFFLAFSVPFNVYFYFCLGSLLWASLRCSF